MIKPKQNKNGTWTAQVYLYTDANGHKVHPRVTANTKDELLYKIGILKLERPTQGKAGMTVLMAIDRYIVLSEVLSPTTLAAYEKIKKFAFQDIMNLQVNKLTDEIIQSAINRESKRPGFQTGKQISAKTVKNEWGLLSSALKTVCNKTFNVKLPKIQHKNEDLPEPAQVIEVIKGTPVELPCLLAMWLSLSMSEIRGLKCSSVKGEYLYIDQVMVEVNNESIVKSNAKVDTRIRKLKLPKYILELINSSESYTKYKETKVDGYLVPMTRNQIYHYYTNRMQKAGLNISFHDLRHIFASVMLTKLQVPEKIVQAEGGWSSDHVMKRVYSQTFSASREEADRLRDEYFMKQMED